MRLSKVCKSADEIANASLRKAILKLIDMKVESEMNAAMKAFKAEMKAQRKSQANEIKSLKWFILTGLGLATLIISLVMIFTK